MPQELYRPRKGSIEKKMGHPCYICGEGQEMAYSLVGKADNALSAHNIQEMYSRFGLHVIIPNSEVIPDVNDDRVVISACDEHLPNLQEIIKTLAKNGWKMNPSIIVRSLAVESELPVPTEPSEP